MLFQLKFLARAALFFTLSVKPHNYERFVFPPQQLRVPVHKVKTFLIHQRSQLCGFTT